MQVVEIKEDQKNLWNQFIAENSSESFLQTWEWGEFQQSLGRKVWKIAVIEEDKIVALALLIKNNIPFFGSYLYCPRGPVVENAKLKTQSSKLRNALFAKIKEIAKRENCFFLRIDPPIEINYELRITNYELKNLKRSFSEVQPKNTLMLNLTKSEEEILSKMKQKTRYNIRLAEKRGVKVTIYDLRFTDCEDFKKGFDEFWKLTSETANRDDFKPHERDYYWKMMETLCADDNENRSSLKTRLYLAEYNGRIIAANIVSFFGDLCIYLHGASSDADKNVMAPHLLQWRQIQDAKKMGCKKYDFWGISLDGEKESWAGITRFKTGFGGEEKRYIGAMDLVFDRSRYFEYKLLRKIRNIL